MSCLPISCAEEPAERAIWPPSPNAELDVVHLRTDRDIAERQCVARTDRRIRTGDNNIAHLQADWRKDVSLLAVRIVQQCDARRAIRVVFDRGHLGRNGIFIPLEVDDAVEAFRSATAMASGDAADIVTTGGLLQWHQERSSPESIE